MRRRMIVAMAVLAIGCKSNGSSDPKGSAAPQTVLAQVGDKVITAADLKQILSRYSNQPFVLARYSSIEKKKQLLDSLIRYDVLAIEAHKQGYDRDPEVQRVAKDKMVKLFVEQEIDGKTKLGDISDKEVERYYEDHQADYMRPETVRVSQILVKDRDRAERVLATARALPKGDLKAFRDLVTKESEDLDSKQRGGDLTQLDRASTLQPPQVVAAAFALATVGDLSAPVRTDKGFVILKLTERHPAVSRPLEEARIEIQKHLLEVMRATQKQRLIDEARKAIRVEIFEDELAKLDLEATQPAEATPAQKVGLDAAAVVGRTP